MARMGMDDRSSKQRAAWRHEAAARCNPAAITEGRPDTAAPTPPRKTPVLGPGHESPCCLSDNPWPPMMPLIFLIHIRNHNSNQRGVQHGEGRI